MKLMSSGWIYNIPPETEFIEVTAVEGERALLEVFDADGNKLNHGGGNLIPAPEPWMKRKDLP